MKKIIFALVYTCVSVAAFGQASVTRNGNIVQQSGLIFTTPKILEAGGGTDVANIVVPPLSGNQTLTTPTVTTTLVGATAVLATNNITIGGDGATGIVSSNLSVSGGNSLAMPGSLTTGVGSSVAGALGLGQGTAPPLGTTMVQVVAPASVTSYNIILAATVGSTGYQKWTVSGGNATLSSVTTIPAADIAVGALANGMTATTQSASDNSTKLASTAYVDTRARTPRVVTTTDDASAVIDATLTDVYQLSAVANATTFSTTGTPIDGQNIVIRWKDAGVAKALTWDAIFVAVGVTLPTTTVAGKWGYVGVQYNAAAGKFHAIATAAE